MKSSVWSSACPLTVLCVALPLCVSVPSLAAPAASAGPHELSVADANHQGDAIVALSAGDGHRLALKADGSVWAWGNGAEGQLGNGTNADSAQAVPVSGLGQIVAIASGAGHSLALAADGSVWAWGRNDHGQLGTGNTVASNVPLLVPGLGKIISIAAQGATSHTVDASGRHWAFGQGAGVDASDSNLPLADARGSSDGGQDDDGSRATAARVTDGSPTTAVARPSAYVMGPRFDGQTIVGQPRTELAAIFNNGPGDLVVSGASVSTGGAHAREFSLGPLSLPITIPAEGYSEIPVVFTPDREGDTADKALRLSSNASEPLSAELFGTGVGRADWEVSLKGPRFVRGSQVSYEIRVRNLGPDVATDFRLDAPAPEGMVFDYATFGLPDSVCYRPAPGDAFGIRCDFGNVKPGTEYLIRYALKRADPKKRMKIVNNATVLELSKPRYQQSYDPNPDNNSAAVTTDAF